MRMQLKFNKEFSPKLSMKKSHIDIETYFFKNQEKTQVYPYTVFKDNDYCVVFSMVLFKNGILYSQIHSWFIKQIFFQEKKNCLEEIGYKIDCQLGMLYNARVVT